MWKKPAAKRQAVAREKTAKDDLESLTSVGVLVLCPSTFVVENGLTIPLSENPPIQDLMHQQNIDFCSYFLDSLHPTTVIQHDPQNANAVFPSAHMVVARLAEQNLKEEVGITHRPWSYTQIITFMNCYDRDKDGFRKWLYSAGVKLIILGPPDKWEVPDNVDKSQEILDFCYSLAKDNICLYPPVRCCNLFHDKERRHAMFQSVMLPSSLVTVTPHITSWGDMVDAAKQINQGALQAAEKVVVKGLYGGCCNGVHVLALLESGWEEVTGATYESAGYVVGSKVFVEPFMSAFQPQGEGALRVGGEERMMVHLFNKSMSRALYHTVAYCPERGVLAISPIDSVPQTMSILEANGRVRTTVCELLHGSFPTSHMNLRNLMFRVDMVKVIDHDEIEAIGVDPNARNVFVNEIEIYPFASDLIDNYEPTIGADKIRTMAAALSDFIKENWPNGWQV